MSNYNMVSRYSLHIALAGIVLVVFSMVPLMGALVRMMDPAPTERLDFDPDGSLQALLDVDGVSEMSLRLVFEIAGEPTSGGAMKIVVEAGQDVTIDAANIVSRRVALA